MKRTIAMAAALAVVVLLAATAGAIWLGGRGGAERFAECGGGTTVGGEIGGAFDLVREDGQSVTDAEVIDRLTLVYFGYTYCPDVCPIDVARNVEAVALLEEEGIDIKPVMITVDPQRDTPEVMARYTNFLHDRLIGLTGSPEQIERVKQAYGAYGARAGAGGGDEDYLVDHTTYSYLMAPEEGFLTFFRRDVGPQEMADTMACYAAAL